MVESFNVSVAAGIVLSEALHQKQKVGHYDQQQLSEVEYKRLFFEWAHPKITEYCQLRGLSYPELNDEGEIINPSEWFSQVKKALK